MVLVRKWQFFQLFFIQYRPGKCLLRYSKTKKTPFWAIKIRSLNNGKINIFPKGLTHGFSTKMAIFHLFLGNIGEENVFYDIRERKNAFAGDKNKKFTKSRNLHFSKGVNPCFWFKNGHFSKCFFKQYRPGKCLLRYSRTKKRLHDILKQKNTLLGYNNKKFKNSNN